MTGSFQQANFDSDANHFIYCPEGDTVQIDVLAKFLDGTDCDDECSHGPRSYTWTVTGATNYTIDSQTDGPHKSFITVTLGEADDTISIQCAVSATSEGVCDEDRFGNPGEHGGDHGGATAACTIKLWRIDMEVTGGAAEQDPIYPFSYETTFASSVTTTASLVGALPVISSPPPDAWNWESTELYEYELLNTMSGSNSWTGIMVAPTSIETSVFVVNECNPAMIAFASQIVIINPTKRRGGWVDMAVSHAGEDNDWQKNEPDGFPIVVMEDFKAWAQNTNSNAVYEDYNQVIVTPVYSGGAVDSAHLANFDGVRDAILSGPNYTLWYLSDPDLFECARKSRINYWITPTATKSSSAPVDGPNSISYSNWSDIYIVTATDTCACSNPSSHGAVGGNIRYKANVWHEGYGCPGSANQDKLGHQIRIENALIDGPEYQFDAIWLSDLLWAKSLSGIEAAAESARATASNNLKAETLGLHTYVTNAPQEHNFRGITWITDGTDWDTDGPVSTY